MVDCHFYNVCRAEGWCKQNLIYKRKIRINKYVTIKINKYIQIKKLESGGVEGVPRKRKKTSKISFDRFQFECTFHLNVTLILIKCIVCFYIVQPMTATVIDHEDFKTKRVTDHPLPQFPI